MTKFRKTVLSLAVMAAAGGAVNSAQAVNLAADGLGDVLLFPYYTVRNEWQTLIHLVNTSSTHTVALKVRYQDANTTNDVLDFTLVMSPNDVWTSWIQTDDDGTARLHSTDSTCTSPIMPAAGFEFDPQNVGGLVDRTLEGHVTIIEMGASNSGTIHTAAKAKNCTVVDNGFSTVVGEDGFTPVNVTSNQFGEPLNVIKGSFSMIRLEKGLSVGGSPTTLANFFTPCTAASAVDPVVCSEGTPPSGAVTGAAGQNVDGAVVAVGGAAADSPGVLGNYGVRNLIVAQQYPDFLMPTLNDANPPVSMIQDDTVNATQQPRVDIWRTDRRADAVSAVLMRSNVINEWSTNPANGVETYWTVSFPTRLHYLGTQPTQDELDASMLDDSPYANLGTVNTEVGGTNPFVFSTPGNCATVVFNLFDRSEGGVVSGGTSVSPAPPTPLTALCNEVNVLSFSPTANLLGSHVAKSVDVTKLVSGEPFGWMNLAMPVALGNTITGTQSTALGPNSYQGLPVIGFNLWSRAWSATDKTKNYGHLIDHSFKRKVGVPVTNSGG